MVVILWMYFIHFSGCCCRRLRRWTCEAHKFGQKMKKNNDTKSIFMNRFIWFGLCLAMWCGVVCFGLLEKGGPVPKYTIQAYTHLDH